MCAAEKSHTEKSKLLIHIGKSPATVTKYSILRVVNSYTKTPQRYVNITVPTTSKKPSDCENWLNNYEHTSKAVTLRSTNKYTAIYFSRSLCVHLKTRTFSSDI